MNNTENNNLSIHNLRKQGYKIRCFHQRFDGKGRLMQTRWFKEKKMQDCIMARGGLTILQITTPDKQDIEVQAKCSKKDGFNRKRAIQICLGRLMIKLNEKK